MDLFDTSPSSSPRIGGRSPGNNDGSMNSMNWLLGDTGAKSTNSSVNSNGSSSNNANYQTFSRSSDMSARVPSRHNSFNSGSRNASVSNIASNQNNLDRTTESLRQKTFFQQKLYHTGINLSHSSNGSNHHMFHISSSGLSLHNIGEENLRGSLAGNGEINEKNSVSPKNVKTERKDQSNVVTQSVLSCTKNISGLYGLEVWRFDQSTGELINSPIISQGDEESHGVSERTSSGMFIQRTTQEADPYSPDFNSEARDAFERLTDPCRLDHIYPSNTRPGVGLAGLLWSEASTSNAMKAVRNGVQSIRGVPSIRRFTSEIKETLKESNDHIVWREVNTLAQDPLQPYDERLQLYANAGFSLAAGIPYDIHGSRGIIIFFANPHMNHKILRCDTNSRLIQFASQLIGASVAVHEPLREAELMKSVRPVQNWRRLRTKIMAFIRFQRPLMKKRRRDRSNSFSPQMRRSNSFHLGLRKVRSFVAGGMRREMSFRMMCEVTTRVKKDIATSVNDAQYALKARGMKWWRKIHGGNAGIPPPFNLIQCVWTFIGSMTTHAILSWMNEAIAARSAGELTLIFAPLGALTTLQYNLTAAPPSQPRNALFSQIISMFTVYSLYQFPSLDSWHRTALAPAIVETVTAKLGIIHPPSGASAIAFAADLYGIEHMGVFLLGVCVAITTAIIINNLSDKRQYPTNWPILRAINAMYNSSPNGK
mmetsp:Transcript_26092/g.54952  ORF Transcript_26092/g.54952 Transcript_26092/m.54952 type:complete len:709 (-) Transcript_26092:56-2182(-)